MQHRVTFTVNACITDAPFLEKTLRHVFRSLDFHFCERLIAYDPGNPGGKYRDRGRGDRRQLLAIFERLIADGLIDRVDTVPWDEESQKQVTRRFFGHEDISPTDMDGAPIYQYLYAIDRCIGDYVFHMDSDMLFHTGASKSWLTDGIEMLESEPQVVFATCGSPPKARTWLERVLKRPLRKRMPNGWYAADSFSTRYFLMDTKRFKDQLIPLVPARRGEMLEKTIFNTLIVRGLERRVNSCVDNWAIHPRTHDENYVRYLDELIWAVEHGVYPFVRPGFCWNLHTEGREIQPWLEAIAVHKRRMRDGDPH